MSEERVKEELRSYVIHVDVSKFSQVLRNLLSNALKFTPREGHVSVELELLRKENRAETRSDSVLPEEQEVVYDTLRLSVTDTGAGISEVSQSFDHAQSDCAWLTRTHNRRIRLSCLIR